jgi:hypothetical protein
MTGDEARRRAGYLTAAELVDAMPAVRVPTRRARR